ncbi:type I secretion system permease/ATPase [Morganella psychrotolerans]|uniref:Type I secretion system permease/ATPase n=4 Tax=Morganella psychrotolerans TaxID=368603 RepID=A0A5M9RCY0_9GAMM|nr:type I secretion system permease/ATPase [Morganella psychrotolerans]
MDYGENNTVRDNLENYREAIVNIANHYRLDFSPENVNVTAKWYQDSLQNDDIIKLLAKQCGLMTKFVKTKNFKFNVWSLPVVIALNDGRVGVVQNICGNDVTVLFSANHGLPEIIHTEFLAENTHKIILLRPMVDRPDPRVDLYIKPTERHWLWRILLRDVSPYKYVIMATFLINVLGLAGITYSMQTYDRIIPSQSYPTMVVLVIGVMIAFVFDYILKMLRYGIIDLLGKKADLRMSDRVYGHSLRLKDSSRPPSTGSFISQLRDLEQVREMMTSSTVAAIADLPFFLFFLFIIYLIGGVVCVIPLVGFFLMIMPGLLSQKKLFVLANEAMRESTLRSGMIVESVQGLDDIKAMQAEYRFQQQWIHYTKTSAEASLKLKHLTHKLGSMAYFIQNSVFIGVICAGTPLVISGELSTGALVASSILSSRMMGPISQIANIITRWQQTKVSVKGLTSIMELPVDHPEYSKRVHLPFIAGQYTLNNVGFKFRAESKQNAVFVQDLVIKPGERIAIIGRNGAGKSSLLSALFGKMEYEIGSITLDNIELNTLDPSDLRRDVGFLGQNARLFYGTVRDNLTLGNPLATDEEIYAVLEKTGAGEFVNNLPEGLSYIIQEGGMGISGGQRQSLLISRLLIKEPTVLLLDEPTASLDDITENQFIKSLEKTTAGKTLILTTHRKKLLNIVDRIIVVSGGRIVLDKPKKEALLLLAGETNGQ